MNTPRYGRSANPTGRNTDNDGPVKVRYRERKSNAATDIFMLILNWFGAVFCGGIKEPTKRK